MAQCQTFHLNIEREPLVVDMKRLIYVAFFQGKRCHALNERTELASAFLDSVSYNLHTDEFNNLLLPVSTIRNV